MRYEPALFLSAPTVRLGESAETAAEAVAAGQITALVAEKYGYEELAVSDLAPVDMAERAAADALGAAGVRAGELNRLLHAWTHHQGHDFWSPAHYVAFRLGALQAVPVGIQQMCNGGMAAVDAAAREMIADESVRQVLVTTADRFSAPGFDRWGGDLGVCYGDGATAVLLTRTPLGRAARLLSSDTVAAVELEGMHRGDLPFTSAPRGGRETLRPRLTKQQFRAAHPAADLAKTAHAALATVIERSLSAAGVAADDSRIRAIALPRLSRNGLDEVYRSAIGDACPAPVLDLGRATGHLGAGDAVANLADILGSGALRPGDLAILISAGAGFTWSAAVVEVV